MTALSEKGYKVGVIKHDGHDFQADHEGTDSFRHKMAGAQNVIVYSQHKVMMIRDNEDLSLESLIALQADMDIIILEGMKYSSYPKLEIVRGAVSKEAVCEPKTLLALVTDTACEVKGVPKLALDDFAEILKCVMAFLET